jgi:hypothetical protein
MRRANLFVAYAKHFFASTLFAQPVEQKFRSRNIYALFSSAETLNKTLYSRAFSAENASKPAWIMRYS